MNLFCVKFTSNSVLKILKISVRIFNKPSLAFQTGTFLMLTVGLPDRDVPDVDSWPSRQGRS
jgi:hypothetical protein